VSFKVLSPAYRPCPSYAHASLTSSTWITCPPSPLSSEDFSLVQMLLIFLILRQQNQARCLLAKGFLSMYPPIVYHAFFLRPQHNLRSFYLCRIPLHSTFSSTGCILDVLNTSKTVSTGALFSYLESPETLRTWVCQISSANPFVAGSVPGKNPTCLLLLPVTTRNLRMEKSVRI